MLKPTNSSLINSQFPRQQNLVRQFFNDTQKNSPKKDLPNKKTDSLSENLVEVTQIISEDISDYFGITSPEPMIPNDLKKTAVNFPLTTPLPKFKNNSSPTKAPFKMTEPLWQNTSDTENENTFLNNVVYYVRDVNFGDLKDFGIKFLVFFSMLSFGIVSYSNERILHTFSLALHRMGLISGMNNSDSLVLIPQIDRLLFYLTGPSNRQESPPQQLDLFQPNQFSRRNQGSHDAFIEGASQEFVGEHHRPSNDTLTAAMLESSNSSIIIDSSVPQHLPHGTNSQEQISGSPSSVPQTRLSTNHGGEIDPRSNAIIISMPPHERGLQSLLSNQPR